MRFTKLILPFLAVAALVSSCLNGSYYSTYIANCDFDWTDFAQQYPDSIYHTQAFVSGSSIIFNVKCDEDTKEFLGGFTISMLCDTLVEPGHVSRSPYCVADTTGAFHSSGFTVFTQNPDPEKMPEHDIFFAQNDAGSAVANMVYICNTTDVANLVIYGNDEIPPFGMGDYLTVTFTSFLNGQKQNSKTADLARYSEKERKTVIVWDKVDLTGLGEFDVIDIDLNSNRTDIPMMCGIDSFKATVTIGDK